MTTFNVSSSPAALAMKRCTRNRALCRATDGWHIHPAKFDSANGSIRIHSTRNELRDVRPPQE